MSTNGPFLVERAISQFSVPNSRNSPASDDIPVNCQRNASSLLAAADDECVGTLVIARFVTSRRLSPRSHRMTAAGCLAFATPMRVIDWIHRHPAVMGTASQPAHPSRLADRDILVIGVAHLTDRGHAVEQNFARLTRGQLHQRVVAFFGYQLSGAAG